MFDIFENKSCSLVFAALTTAALFFIYSKYTIIAGFKTVITRTKIIIKKKKTNNSHVRRETLSPHPANVFVRVPGGDEAPTNKRNEPIWSNRRRDRAPCPPRGREIPAGIGKLAGGFTRPPPREA